jgi:hypothetical protein
MLPQDNRAAPPASAQGTPSPDEHIVRNAHVWNRDRKAVIGSTGEERARNKSKLRQSEQRLAESCDHATRKAKP